LVFKSDAEHPVVTTASAQIIQMNSLSAEELFFILTAMGDLV